MDKQDQQQEGIIRPYEADGIQECDNPLPSWWVGLFILTILFAIAYITYFHVMGRPDHIEKFNTFAAARKAAASAPNSTTESKQDLSSRLADPNLIAAGQQTFVTNCAPCHKPDGSGSIGPNLTDDYWMHGDTAEDIMRDIEQGVLEKGMPPWKDILGTKKIEELTALILSWRGKNLKGKEPQGERAAPH